ncbi:MAG: tRNA (adenosine(37)-N6)-threonylcarbamoyltransferase complex ATPase subunit type 1 TsaE [candidate division WOR-3 bacterium]
MPITKSPEETMRLAEKLVEGISSPVCIALLGELGAGKTVFVKGMDEGIVAIEWAERAAGFLPEKRIEVEIKILPEGSREIVINDNRN